MTREAAGKRPGTPVEEAGQWIERKVKTVGVLAARLATTLNAAGKKPNLTVWSDFGGAVHRGYQGHMGGGWLLDRLPRPPYDGVCLLDNDGMLVYYQQDQHAGSMPQPDRPRDVIAIAERIIDFRDGTLAQDTAGRGRYFGIHRILYEQSQAYDHRLNAAGINRQAVSQNPYAAQRINVPTMAEFDLGVAVQAPGSRRLTDDQNKSYTYAHAYTELLTNFAAAMGIPLPAPTTA